MFKPQETLDILYCAAESAYQAYLRTPGTVACLHVVKNPGGLNESIAASEDEPAHLFLGTIKCSACTSADSESMSPAEQAAVVCLVCGKMLGEHGWLVDFPYAAELTVRVPLHWRCAGKGMAA